MKRHWIFILIVGWMALSLVACTRSAATPPPPTPTLGAPSSLPGGIYPTPIGGQVNAATATSLAAQAAMMQTLGAEAGGGEGGTPEATFVPATATPTLAPTATPVPPTAVSLPTVGVPATYTIHKGEYPYCLARRFNIDPNTLLAVNGLSRGQYVFPGTVLTIPRNAPPFPGNRAWHPHPDTYTVRYGDTIYSIACYYGDVSPEAIAAANGISVNAPLTPGQTLHIP